MSLAAPASLDGMETGPFVTERPAQPYVAERCVVTMPTISRAADRIPEVAGWLAGRGIAPAGAPFLKYDVIDMDGALEIEAGFPLAGPVDAGDPADGDQVFAGILPAGRYVTLTYVGPYSRLGEVTARLLAWAVERGLEWDMTRTPAGERWGCRLEIYKTNPAEEPDPGKWETELAFRLPG